MLVSHWRSLEVTPFDRLHTSSYSSSIVTMAVSCTIFEIKRGIGKNGNLSYSLARSPILFAHNFNANCPNPWASKRCKNITEKFKYMPRMQQRHRWHTDDRRTAPAISRKWLSNRPIFYHIFCSQFDSKSVSWATVDSMWKLHADS